MFIQTETTPNPATLKFLPGRDILGEGGLDFASPEQAERAPLALALFRVDGVAAVYLGGDFITVTKVDDVEWGQLKPSILSAIMDHLTAGAPIVTDLSEAAEGQGHSARDGYDDASAEVVDQIVELLDTRIRPAVAQDGGDILFDRFEPDTGVVFLHLRGSCAGCPASTMTLKQGVENMLKHYVPEVRAVEATL